MVSWYIHSFILKFGYWRSRQNMNAYYCVNYCCELNMRKMFLAKSLYAITPNLDLHKDQVHLDKPKKEKRKKIILKDSIILNLAYSCLISTYQLTDSTPNAANATATLREHNKTSKNKTYVLNATVSHLWQFTNSIFYTSSTVMYLGQS